MATNPFTCPKSCDEAELPVVDFNDCMTSADLHQSEINLILIARADASPIENPEVATEWLARVSQTATSKDAIRPITVIGDKPASTSTPIQVSNNRTLNGKKTVVINFTVDEVTDPNYNFFRAMECGGRYKIWYGTLGGKLYGGPNGIKLKGQTVDPINERGVDSNEVINGTLTWESATSFPDRITSPIAASDFDAGNGTTPPEVEG